MRRLVLLPAGIHPTVSLRLLSITTTTTTPPLLLRLFSSLLQSHQPPPPSPSVPAVLSQWGCTAADVSTILSRHPAVGTLDGASLHSKLETLREIGFRDGHLIRLITCLPRFLRGSPNRLVELGLRVDFLTHLFGSRELSFRIIGRNPAVLLYDTERVRGTVEAYDRMGVRPTELCALLLARPMLLTRSSLDRPEKVEFIRRTGVPVGSRSYKYVVSIIGVCRVETIVEKVANFLRFGLSESEVWRLIGLIPNVLTYSVERVDRHMSFIVGTMNLSPGSVARCPVLLQASLDVVVRPRFLVMRKLEEMGVLEMGEKRITKLRTAMRMKENAFVSTFIASHEKVVEEEVMELYLKMLEVARLAEASTLRSKRGFPF